MITGLYDAAHGAFVTGSVYFPPPTARRIDVSFLVDSGAAKTCLSITDFIKLGADASKLPMRPSPIAIRGVGGGVRPFLTVAGLLFVHDDGQFSTFGMELPLILDPSFVGMPSLLGRDILYRGLTRFEPGSREVVIELPVGPQVLA